MSTPDNPHLRIHEALRVIDGRKWMPKDHCFGSKLNANALELAGLDAISARLKEKRAGLTIHEESHRWSMFPCAWDGPPKMGYRLGVGPTRAHAIAAALEWYAGQQAPKAESDPLIDEAHEWCKARGHGKSKWWVPNVVAPFARAMLEKYGNTSVVPIPSSDGFTAVATLRVNGVDIRVGTAPDQCECDRSMHGLR